MSIKRFSIVFLFASLVFAQTPSTKYAEPTCPNNNFSKDKPSPETTLKTCKQYACYSCCAENITAQLAQLPLKQIGNVNMHQCEKPLSPACSMETTHIECFYHCSPNLFPWIGANKRLRQIPLCAKFCNRWFGTCMADLTCATENGNWKTGIDKGFNKDGSAKEPCFNGSVCRNYSVVYENGRNLCNNIWGDLFVYTEDEEKCVDPSSPKHNAEAVKHMNDDYETSDCAPQSISYTDVGMIVGVVFGVVGALFFIAVGIAYYLRMKRTKENSGNERGRSPAEMKALKSNSEPPTNDQPTGDQSDAGS